MQFFLFGFFDFNGCMLVGILSRLLNLYLLWLCWLLSDVQGRFMYCFEELSKEVGREFLLKLSLHLLNFPFREALQVLVVVL